MAEMQINLGSAEFLADPYPTYRYLREEQPAYFMAHSGETSGMWLITRYEDVAATLKEANLSKDSSRFIKVENPSPFDRNLLGLDPPDHTRLRSLAGQAFTPRRIKDLEPRIQAITRQLLEPARLDGGMDFMPGFAVPLPVIVVCELLGVPAEERDEFREWSVDFMRGIDAATTNDEARQRQERATQSLFQYFQALIAQRRQARRDDLISAMIQARDEGDRLNEEELLAMCMLLLIAGHETTVNLLGNGLLALLRHPEQMELLRRQPELVESAVEEMLRFESPVQRATFRIATAPLTIAGQEIAPGQQVSAVIGAANRDAGIFAEPERFDVRRQPNRHLAFGLGIHFCLGAPLSRTEGRIAFKHLLGEFQGLRLANGEAADWNRNTFMRGLLSLPLEVA